MVRVCEPTYKTDLLEQEGIPVTDLVFDDGTFPPNDVSIPPPPTVYISDSGDSTHTAGRRPRQSPICLRYSPPPAVGVGNLIFEGRLRKLTVSWAGRLWSVVTHCKLAAVVRPQAGLRSRPDFSDSDSDSDSGLEKSTPTPTPTPAPTPTHISLFFINRRAML